MGNPLSAAAFVDVFVKDETHDFCGVLVDYKIVDLLILLVDPSLLLELVAKWYNAAGEAAVLCKLLHAGFHAHGGLDALAGCLPVTDIVKQLVNVIVEPLLPFYGAPNFNAITDKPLYDKGRFVISAAETVKHIDKQNIETPGNGFLLQFLHGVALFCRFLETGYAFFVKLIL